MRQWLAALAIALAATAAMVWPVIDLAHLGSSTFGGDTLWAAWTLAWNNHVVLGGGSAYFDANIFYPTRRALAGNEHLFAPALAALPVYAATRNALLAYDLVWLVSFPACALAAFGLASLVSRRFLPRMLAGLVYAFAFFRFEHALHVQYLWTFGFPLSLWALHRWRQTGSVPVLAVWCLAVILQSLTSWYLAVLCLFINGFWLLWLLAGGLSEVPGEARGVTLERGWLRTGLELAAAGAVIAAVLWWFARPYLALPPAPAGEALVNAADWRGYLAPPRSTLPGQLLLRSGIALPVWSFERANFLGFVPLGLSIVGVAAAWRASHPGRRVVAFFACAGAAALLLSFGPSAAARSGGLDWTPFGLLGWLPGMKVFRAPGRFALLVGLAVAMLSAAGADALARRRVGRVLLLCALPLILLETCPVFYEIGRPHRQGIPPIYRFLSGLPAGPVVSLPSFTKPPANWFEADYMLFSTAHWMPIMNGYSRALPPGQLERLTIAGTFPSPEAIAMLRALGVRYVVTHSERYGVDLRPAIASAAGNRDLELVVQDGGDYLWRVTEKAD